MQNAKCRVLSRSLLEHFVGSRRVQHPHGGLKFPCSAKPPQSSGKGESGLVVSANWTLPACRSRKAFSRNTKAAAGPVSQQPREPPPGALKAQDQGERGLEERKLPQTAVPCFTLTAPCWRVALGPTDWPMDGAGSTRFAANACCGAIKGKKVRMAEMARTQYRFVCKQLFGQIS